MTSQPPAPSPVTPGGPRSPALPPPAGRLLAAAYAAACVLAAGGLYLGLLRLAAYATGRSYQNPFTFWMLLLHLAVGILVIVPLVVFIVLHVRVSRRFRNRRAIRAGVWLAVAAGLLVLSGLMLLKNFGRSWHAIAYWVHVLSPLLVVVFYARHRRAGRLRLRLRRGAWVWSATTAVFLAAMLAMHPQDPRGWLQQAPAGGEAYFEPSLARTSTGKLIASRALMMDEYCKDCHSDTYNDWLHSAHRFSSFNNPVYDFSIRELRQTALERDGNATAIRWCAGCHDPVPFFSGRFADRDFLLKRDETASAGVGCVTCHSIIAVNSTRGNGDYVIEEPLHYPFAYSTSSLLKWINHRLIKANPAFHKKTFLKPLHKTAEFCSACHKVHIPYEVNKYKPFLRGQDHYDSYLLSGVSGHGARSFYYPAKAFPNCSERCHMPLKASADCGNRGGLIHDHFFPGANTGIAELRGDETAREANARFLRDGQVRVDIFGLREGGAIDSPLLAPLRPRLPALKPGGVYLVEVVLRTLKMGHHLTQGTTDSNQLWVDVEASSAQRTLGRSGAIDSRGKVDPWSNFVNVLTLDRHGNRIDRRNVADIFVPLYNHQIPPGAAQTIHYRLEVPRNARELVTIRARLRYRKFDRTLLEFVYGPEKAPDLTPVDLCEDVVVLPVEGSGEVAPPPQESAIPEWERWNDYGIGLFLKGKGGAEKGELRQAEEVFRRTAELGSSSGWLNLVRVYDKAGRLDEAVEALRKAIAHPHPPPPWTTTWLRGRINRQNGRLDDAVRDLERVLRMRVPERGFDFSLDAMVSNELGRALFDRSQGAVRSVQERKGLLERARDAFLHTLSIDSENTDAHYNLYLIHSHLRDREEAEKHLKLFNRYRVDDNAADRAHAAYRSTHPPANKAAQSIVIYDLKPPA